MSESSASSAAAGLAATDSVSPNAYDGIALGLFRYFSEGLILDAGTRCNPDYQPHVVNLEVVPCPTCDVLAIGERLPFRDESFDALLSLAVLKHVRDPFACAKEIQRVLTPGGFLYAVIPLIQPYHAYPYHYDNMSHQGSGESLQRTPHRDTTGAAERPADPVAVPVHPGLLPEPAL